MECTKHVVTNQRDITIRDLRDRVAELEAECGAIAELARDYVDGDGMTLVRYLAGEEPAMVWLRREAHHLLNEPEKVES